MSTRDMKWNVPTIIAVANTIQTLTPAGRDRSGALVPKPLGAISPPLIRG